MQQARSTRGARSVRYTPFDNLRTLQNFARQAGKIGSDLNVGSIQDVWTFFPQPVRELIFFDIFPESGFLFDGLKHGVFV